jgi:predicted nucleotide-binding protein (sugar kinase/HSP70/actin superfamily)
MTATGAANVTVSKLNLEGSSAVSFKCGQASIVVDSGGVMIKGTQITLKAPTIEVKTPNIGTI